jgi:hypothetical protein
LENYRTVLFAALGFGATDRITYQNTNIDVTANQRWINIVVDLRSEDWGAGGDYTWHFNLILEVYTHASTNINLNEVRISDILYGQVIEAHQNRATWDLWDSLGIKIMGVDPVGSVPQTAQSPGKLKKLITIECYIHNENTGQPAPVLPP